MFHVHSCLSSRNFAKPSLDWPSVLPTAVDQKQSLADLRKRKLVALLLLSYRCIVAINVLWLFLTVRWVGLLCVIVVFPDHTHLLFEI